MLSAVYIQPSGDLTMTLSTGREQTDKRPIMRSALGATGRQPTAAVFGRL